MALSPTFRRLALLWWRVTLTLAVVYVGWTFLARYLAGEHWKQRQHSSATASQEAAFERTYGGTDLKILQFYARDGVVLEGRQTVICYGVVNARAVRLDPPVADVSPSLNRCIEAAPEHNTRYTLTAEGASGQAVSASFEIQVEPDPAELPRITYFRAGKPRIEDGRLIVRLEFGQENGQLVEIDPPVFPALHGAPLGQFYVAPHQTTTYTLTVTGKRGHRARRSLTVEVPPA
ncbi:MAG TPA: hypothetical protein VME43_11980 [Bryobacteraceae bacterium]|nr:hypothetical protein [Bryobacteraceae bacterium]